MFIPSQLHMEMSRVGESKKNQLPDTEQTEAYRPSLWWITFVSSMAIQHVNQEYSYLRAYAGVVFLIGGGKYSKLD